MSTGDPPVMSPSEQVTSTAAPAEGESIPLAPISPPPPRTVSPGTRRRVRFLEGLLLLLVLAFAFLCASFPASNFDLFMHLATGRLIAQGAYPFGSDPFTFTAQGTWVNHSWLYSLLTYLVYSIPVYGPVVLVVLKALVVTALAWVLVKAGSLPGQGSWLGLLFALLALLTLSPRLLLQPAVLSMFFLALTLYLLLRQDREPGGKSVWALPALCLLWVNLDSWFLLGPLTVLLWLAGDALEGARKREQVKRLGLVLASCLLACLVNPYHVRAFTVLPPGLVTFGEVEPFARDSMYRFYFLSPFMDLRTYFAPTIGLSPAGLAYFALLAVSLASFIAVAAWTLEGLRWPRVLVWLAFALLGAFHLLAVPYFAIVAGPLTALNFLELGMRQLGEDIRPERVWQRWAVTGRVLTALVALLLVLTCMPGWLQAQPHHRRRVGWGVEPDQGLEQAALQVARWRDLGLLSPPAEGRHWFNLNPDVAAYFAWFCPGEKAFADHRLELFGGVVARDLIAVRRSFSGEDAPAADDKGEPAPPAWRRIFRKHGVRFVVMYSSQGSPHRSLGLLFSAPEEFVPCYVEGSTAIFAWQDPHDEQKQAAADVLPKGLKVDFEALAFGANALQPPEQPARRPGTLPWWQDVLQGEPATPTETATAQQHNLRFRALTYRYSTRSRTAWTAAVCSAMVGAGAVPGGVPVPVDRLGSALLWWSLVPNEARGGTPTALDHIASRMLYEHMRSRDSGPVESLYLAVRSARQGLSKSPDDILGQLALAESYASLAYNTRERSRTAALRWRELNRPPGEQAFFPHVQQIRQTQVAAALQNVLKVNTSAQNKQLAHFLLSEVFREPQYQESRLAHTKEVLELAKQLGRLPFGSPATFGEQIKALEQQIKSDEQELKTKRSQVVLKTVSSVAKAKAALQAGLSETALKLLKESDPKELMASASKPDEVAGAAVLIDLLLGLGQLDDVREALEEPDSGSQAGRRAYGMHPLGLPAYEWFQIQLGAALGDYAGADKYLAESLAATQKGAQYTAPLVQMDLVPESWRGREGDQALLAGVLVGQALLREAPQAAGLPWQIMRRYPYRLQADTVQLRLPPIDAVLVGSRFLNGAMEQQADLWTLRGWLALEAGKTDDARKYAEKALALADRGSWGKGQKMIMPFRSRPLAALVLDLAERGLPNQ